MGKRGQLDISFGMIFSIIIIIATLAVSGYVIFYFVRIGNCTNSGLFYKALDDRVQEAWNSPITKSVFEGSIPSGVDSVCFGNLSQMPSADSRVQFDKLKLYRSSGGNVFLYPLTNGCSNANPYFKVEHIQTSGFFCLNVVNGKIRVQIAKDSSDSLVRLSKP